MDWEPLRYDVERGALRRFARAVGDPNPLWQDMAPPTFILAVGLEQVEQRLWGMVSSGAVIHGSTEAEYYGTIRAGDTIIIKTKLASIRERPGKRGKMVFLAFDAAYENQKQVLVARSRQTIIVTEKAG